MENKQGCRSCGGELVEELNVVPEPPVLTTLGTRDYPIYTRPGTYEYYRCSICGMRYSVREMKGMKDA